MPNATREKDECCIMPPRALSFRHHPGIRKPLKHEKIPFALIYRIGAVCLNVFCPPARRKNGTPELPMVLTLFKVPPRPCFFSSTWHWKGDLSVSDVVSLTPSKDIENWTLVFRTLTCFQPRQWSNKDVPISTQETKGP